MQKEQGINTNRLTGQSTDHFHPFSTPLPFTWLAPYFSPLTHSSLFSPLPSPLNPPTPTQSSKPPHINAAPAARDAAQPKP